MGFLDEIKKTWTTSKSKFLVYIILFALGIWLWYISIPIFGVYWIIKKTKLTSKQKWLYSTIFVLTFLVIGGFFIGSPAAPTIVIQEPNADMVIDSRETLIKGKVAPAKAEVLINDQPIEKDAEGNFSYKASLPDETNRFVVQAKNEGKTTTQNLDLKRALSEEEKAAQEKKRAEEQAKQKAAQEAEKKAQIEQEKKKANILGKLTSKVDDIQGVTFYHDKTTPQRNDTNNISLYIVKPESGSSYLRLKIQYEGSDWLFIQKYSIKADDRVFEIVPPAVERDNYTNIWEWSDFIPSDKEMENIVAIVNSKEAKIRYQGQTYYKDRVITAAEKSALRNIVEAYKVMQ